MANGGHNVNRSCEFTPTSSSWLNLVERWFAALTEKHLRRGVFRSTLELEAALLRYLDPCHPRSALYANLSDSGHYGRLPKSLAIGAAAPPLAKEGRLPGCNLARQPSGTCYRCDGSEVSNRF